MKKFHFLLATLLGCGALAYSHHSFAGTYLEDAPPQQIQGKLVQFLLRNPHSFVHVEAKDEKGVVQRWSLEWRSAGSLGQSGIGRDTLQIGDDVVITMSPSRTPTDHRGVLKTLHRTKDGLGWGDRPGESVD